jgi:hypothetical protein
MKSNPSRLERPSLIIRGLPRRRVVAGQVIQMTHWNGVHFIDAKGNLYSTGLSQRQAIVIHHDDLSDSQITAFKRLGALTAKEASEALAVKKRKEDAQHKALIQGELLSAAKRCGIARSKIMKLLAPATKRSRKAVR